MNDPCPDPTRSCPFIQKDGLARLTILEHKLALREKTKSELVVEMRAIKEDLVELQLEIEKMLARVQTGWWVIGIVGTVGLSVGMLLSNLGVKVGFKP